MSHTTTDRPAPAIRVRKGDIVAAELTRQHAYINGESVYDAYRWRLATVEKATRDGYALKVSWQVQPGDTSWRTSDWVRVRGYELPGYTRDTKVGDVLTIPGHIIRDRGGLLAAVDGHKFESVVDLRNAVLPFMEPRTVTGHER